MFELRIALSIRYPLRLMLTTPCSRPRMNRSTFFTPENNHDLVHMRLHINTHLCAKGSDWFNTILQSCVQTSETWPFTTSEAGGHLVLASMIFSCKSCYFYVRLTCPHLHEKDREGCISVSLLLKGQVANNTTVKWAKA